MALARLEGCLQVPDSVQFIAGVLGVQVAGLDDVAVPEPGRFQAIAVVGMYISCLPTSFQSKRSGAPLNRSKSSSVRMPSAAGLS